MRTSAMQAPDFVSPVVSIAPRKCAPLWVTCTTAQIMLCCISDL